MKTAILYYLKTSAMQSSKMSSKKPWVIEFTTDNSYYTSNNHSWAGRRGSVLQNTLYFETKEQALRYIKDNDIVIQYIEDGKKLSNISPNLYSKRFSRTKL